MPFIDVRIHPALTADQAGRIATETTRTMDETMGKRREVTAVCVQALPDALWTIGGTLPTRPTAYVDVKITSGTNSEAQKAALVAQLHAMLDDTLGGLAEASYVVVHELPATDWGYGGRTQAARKVQANGNTP